MRYNYLKSSETINGILNRYNFALLNEFEEKFVDLEGIEETSSKILLENRILVRYAYFLTLIKYKDNADLYKFKEIISGNKAIISSIAKECRCGGELGKVIDEALDYFFGEYISVYSDCINTRHTVDKLIDAINIKEGLYSIENLAKQIDKDSVGKYDYLINPDTFF